MIINLFYLKCFHDAVLTGSISESARRNFVSQPAVSQAITKLEHQVGVALCHHKKQKFKLTAEGEIVFSKAKEIFSAVRGLQDALDQHQKQPKMPLHFVATNSIGLSLFPDLLPRFRECCPNVEVHFLFGGISQIKGWLKQGIAEFALVLQSSDVAEYQNLPLYTGQFRLYKQAQETRTIEEAGWYVEHKQGLLVQEFQSASGKFPILAELNSWELIARTIESHGGYGLLPDMVIRKYPCLVPASSVSLPYTICAIFSKGEKLSYSAQKFLETLSTFLHDQP